MKFRKRPIVIEAIQWKGDNWQALEDFQTDGQMGYPTHKNTGN